MVAVVVLATQMVWVIVMIAHLQRMETIMVNQELLNKVLALPRYRIEPADECGDEQCYAHYPELIEDEDGHAFKVEEVLALFAE